MGDRSEEEEEEEAVDVKTEDLDDEVTGEAPK